MINNNSNSEDQGDLRTAKSEKTRASIVAAATELFLGQGYSKTSLDKVANAANVTKPTVYSHFKSKEGLLGAVIQNFASRPMQEITGFLKPTADPAKDLTQFAHFFVALIFEKDAMRGRRLATTESLDHPEVGKAFYEAGPGRLIKKLSQYFAVQTKSGRLNVTHPANTAEQFIGMLVGLDLLRSQTGQEPTPLAKRKRRCKDAVKVFMNTYGENGC